MILWLLRLFPAFRQIEQLLLRESDERKKAMAERDLWREKAEAESTEVRRLNEKLLETAQKVADTMAIHAIGKRVFSKADPIVGDPQRTQQQAQRHVTARTVQMQKASETRDELRRMMDDIQSA